MRITGESAKVLVTVKATPQPSERYGDTSCVAGIRIDGERASWIRLYPIAFRWLDGPQRFRKYDVIEVEVRRRDSDTRAESYSPTEGSWRVIDTLKPWRPRHDVISRLEPTTTCDMIRAATLDGSAPSLGLVYPTDVGPLQFEPHGDWTAEQLAKMQSRIDRESSALIPSSGGIPNVLKAPRFKVRYAYRCGHGACEGTSTASSIGN